MKTTRKEIRVLIVTIFSIAVVCVSIMSTFGGEPWRGLISSTDALKGQVEERCGDSPPQFDLATQDPFSDVRYQDPPDDFVSPFASCRSAYEEMMSSRSDCSEIGGGRMLLVSKTGEDDPRWRQGVFDAFFDAIQDAIDAANHCDTIIVRPGIYREYLSVDGKDVKIYSDTWNDAGTVEDGNERLDDYLAERIDLRHYYITGKRVVSESRKTNLKPLKRAVRTILEGGGYSEGSTLGGTIDCTPDDRDDPNRGCGNRRPMVDFTAGTTRKTVFDGFTVRLMPEQDHTIPGHGHTLQCRGGSPIIRHNIIYNNGSTGIGVHASWKETTPLTPPCRHDPALTQEAFRNADYRNTNIEYRPVPLVYDNISYQNNGLGLGNNHYSCAVIVNNESFWNAVPGEEDHHQSPGIGVRHGAKVYLEYNIVYENAWTGIGVRQGYLQPVDACNGDPKNCNHINERTQAVILHNIVFNNGSTSAALENQGGIGLDGVGLPDEPVLVQGNIVFNSKVSGIGVRNEHAGVDRGFVLDDTYALIVGNTTFSNARNGISCKGSNYGVTHCTIVGNDVYWNSRSGIGFAENSTGYAFNNVTACNSKAGIVTIKSDNKNLLLNNIAYFNVSAGIVINPGSVSDHNILSGNNGQEASCNEGPRSRACKNPQYGFGRGGSGAGDQDLFTDPLFKDPLGFDYTLKTGSPAIDSGVDISPYYTGWIANGNAPDRGGHEQP